ncbi:MAG: M24 family metallopeptidase, partial [Actinobacteria bacterium]|nr:M24 family metallopeptidase [Actinomycetota bacterium]
ALAHAGRAIDSVHSQMGQWLKAGRTEAEVARDIADAIVAAGHDRMDFVIVASGPNGASPHHDASERVINPGEPVVVDIGGTTPEGYASDCTRMYCVGEPPADFVEYYAVLQKAQAVATAAVKPGVSCEAIDAAAREVLDAAGFGQWFVHRVGHGIGLDTHEHPYMVSGNTRPLSEGMAFSIEPGVYLPGRHGARIEDIVVCGTDGAIVLNNETRELVVL